MEIDDQFQNSETEHSSEGSDDIASNNSESDYSSEGSDQSEDWYNSSDTSDEIPDPNLSEERLYQDINCIPIALSNSHFEEGLIYTMTLSSNRENSMLVWIIEGKKETFVFQCFFNQASKKPTWHETGKNKECRYDEVWRLAPRRELVRPCTPDNAAIGQTLRFTYGVSASTVTVTSTAKTSRGNFFRALGQNTPPRFLVILMFFRRTNLENSPLKVNFFLKSSL